MRVREAVGGRSRTDISFVEAPVITAVIVSYNTRDMTLECLRALAAAARPLSLETWVVDNASTDGSVEAVEQAALPSVQVIANLKNLGFGAANNQAMWRARGEFILLLNSDAFLDVGALKVLTEHLRNHPEVGAVGPRLRYVDGTPQVSCYCFPTPLRAWIENLGLARFFARFPRWEDLAKWDHRTAREVDFIIGACLLVRRCVWEEVGGFDESFFLYSEETDWQRRMHTAGWRIAFTPEATAVHLAGGSGAKDKVRINQHFFTSLDYYVRKHHGLPGLISFRLAMTVGSFVRAIWWSGRSLFAGQRTRAFAKARLHWWLVFRQATRLPPAVPRNAALAA